ncbi:MAG TPA: STAS/SEC14 domain-containing protein [Burkholderiales bacterium]|nr:STAS/SEC14 domain-containing protein [Burkholderiales bacterium]
MIEIIESFPENVIGLIAKGRVTRKDYEEVLIPKIERMLREHEKVRCYYELGQEFEGMDAGAAWEDMIVGLEHFSKWERVAAVTDVQWIAHTLNAFRFLMPGRMKVFPTSEADAAREWVNSE